MPTELRLRNRVANHWTNMHTLPSNHPFWTCRTRLEQQGRRFPSPFAAFHQEWQGVDRNLETITPIPRAPYQPNLNIKIIPNREEAKRNAEDLHGPRVYFTDGSARNQLTGAAAVRINKQGQLLGGKHRTLAYLQDSNLYAAELQAIDLVLEIINQPAIFPAETTTPYIIATDSQGALKSLAKPHYQSGQFIILSIFKTVWMLKKKGYQVQFLWVPAHEGILGNELAYQAALEATVEGRTIDITHKDPKRLRSAAMRNERQLIRQERIQAF